MKDGFKEVLFHSPGTASVAGDLQSAQCHIYSLMEDGTTPAIHSNYTRGYKPAVSKHSSRSY